MIFHVVQTGDTLKSVTLQYLYDASKSSKIRHINNLISDEISIGSTLKIPDLFEEEKIDPNFEGAGLVIDGKDMIAIPEITITRAVNAFTALIDFELPNEQIFRDLIPPFSYVSIDGYFGNEILFSGSNLKLSAENPSKLIMAGKGSCGILTTSNIPLSAYPRTKYNMSFKSISKQLCDIFSIPVVIDDNATENANKKFPKFEIGYNQPVSEVLIDLARQRDLILSETPEGALRVSLDSTEKKDPILNLVDPKGTIAFDSDKLFSDYSCLRSYTTANKTNTANAKIDIPIFRQKTIEQQKRNDGSSKSFLDSQVKATLIDCFSFAVSVPYINTIDGNLLKEGEIITIQSDRNYIKNPTDFIILEITYKMMNGGKVSDLQLFPLDWYKGIFTKFWI